MNGEVASATLEVVREVWEREWGVPIVTPRRQYMPEDVEGLVWRDADGRVLGLVTWAVEGDRAELASVNALEPGRGIGGRLVQAAEEALRARGVRTIVVATTNDNPGALAFYVRCGYRLVRLYPDFMERVRAVKPDVPRTGNEGIPLRDMWELEKGL